MRPRLFLAFLLMLAPLAAGPVAAQAPGIQPLDRLLPQIRRNHPGQFFDADGPTTGADGSSHYHLKWMTPDGRIVWLDTDARTGQVLGQSPGRDAFDRRDGAPGADAPRENPRPDFFNRRDDDARARFGRGREPDQNAGDARPGDDSNGNGRPFGRSRFGDGGFGNRGGFGGPSANPSANQPSNPTTERRPDAGPPGGPFGRPFGRRGRDNNDDGH